MLQVTLEFINSIECLVHFYNRIESRIQSSFEFYYTIEKG